MAGKRDRSSAAPPMADCGGLMRSLVAWSLFALILSAAAAYGQMRGGAQQGGYQGNRMGGPLGVDEKIPTYQ